MDNKKKQTPQFPDGSEVEVSSDEEGFHGIWFPAKIVSQPTKATKNRYLVEYKTLVSEKNGSDPLREHVDPSFVRPPPPSPPWAEELEVNDVVEAYHLDGWWSGAVTEVLGEGKYRVSFKNMLDKVVFEKGNLRVRREWLDGKWVLPQPHNNKTTDEPMFGPGTPVEVNLEHELADVWFPGTVVKEIGKSYFMVEYMSSDNTKLLIVVVDYLHIRPSPPRCNKRTFQLLDKVDAFCNFGWSSGVITKVLGDGRYIVFFKRTKKEKELIHKDLRVPMTQINGKWVHSSQEAAVISNPQKYSDTNLNDIGKISLPHENSGAMNGSAEELRNRQEEKGVPSEKAHVNNRTVSPVKTELATLNSSSCERSCKKLNVEAVPGVQFPPQVCGTKPTVSEELNAQSPGSLANSGTEDNTSMGKSSSSGRKLEAQDDMITYATNKRTPWQKWKGKAHKITLALEAEPRTPKLSAAVIDKPGKKNALDNAVNDGICENTANDGGHEREDLADEATSPKKRKRGRPSSDKTKKKLQIINGAQGSLNSDKAKERLQISDRDGSLRRSAREKKTVYESLQLTSKPVKKKMRMTTDILSSTQEFEDSRKRKAESLLRNSMTQYPEPVSNEDSGNISDDRPLSSQLGGSYSPSIVDGAQSEGKDHVSNETVEHNVMSTKGNDVDAAEKANQSEDDTGQGASEESIHPLPFTKTSLIWNMIEAMEVFRLIPQNPHFQPLYEAKEDRREGLAIGCMVTYSGLVEKISKFQFSDPKSVLDDSMETLSDLERQGFNVKPVRSRLAELMSIKIQNERSQMMSEEVAYEIEERQKQRVAVENELYGEISELDRKIAELMEKRATVEYQIDVQEYEIQELQSRMNSMVSASEAARAEFEKLANAPW